MKLYLVTRRDLPPGARAAQLCHALRAFVEAHPAVDSVWYAESNTLVLLEVADEDALMRLAWEATMGGVPWSLFREPDLGDAATAIAIGPTGQTLVRKLPLALSTIPGDKAQFGRATDSKSVIAGSIPVVPEYQGEFND